jgi:hypothetical protein
LRVLTSLSLYLTESEYSFISEILEKCARHNGTVISESAILISLIKLLQELDVDFSGVETEDQLLARLQNSLVKYRNSDIKSI